MSFQGESHIIGITFESDGVTVDPSLETITNIEARLINRIKGEVVAKWSREEQTGFETMTVDDNRLICYCSASVLDSKQIGNYDFQVNVITPNDNLDGGYVEIYKGELLTLLTANNG